MEVSIPLVGTLAAPGDARRQLPINIFPAQPGGIETNVSLRFATDREGMIRIAPEDVAHFPLGLREVVVEPLQVGLVDLPERAELFRGDEEPGAGDS